MLIIVNGAEEEHPEGATIRAILDRHNLAHAPCAVELNKALIPRREHETTLLRPGDRIEIVTFVGGG